MYTGTVWGITLILLGALLSLGALQLLAAVVFPGMVGASGRIVAERPVRAGLVGIVPVLLVLAALNLLGSGGPPVKLAAFLFLCFVTVLLASGLAGLSLTVGRRLPHPADGSHAWRTLLRGAVVSELSWLVPLVGWFVVLPVAASVALGAAVTALFRAPLRREAAGDLGPPSGLGTASASASTTPAVPSA